MSREAIKQESDSMKKTYYVKGMHCASCEVLVRKEVLKLDDVSSAKVSLSKNTLEIVPKNNLHLSADTLNEVLQKYGYSVSEDRHSSQKYVLKDYLIVGALFLLFVAFFYFFERSWIFASLVVTPSSSIISYFVFGLIAGLSSCAALVGGILLSLPNQWSDKYSTSKYQRALPFIYFNSARIITFFIMGGVLGYLGSAFKISVTFSSILTSLISLLMLTIGLQMLGVRGFKKFKLPVPTSLANFASSDTNLKRKYIPLVVGAITFFLPCGFTLIAQTNALGTGSLSRGALSLLAFSLGTLPILALISFTSLNVHRNQSFAMKFNIFSGFLLAMFALYTFNSQLNVLGLPSLSYVRSYMNKSGPQADLGSSKIDFQVMQMEASGFEYFPSELTILSGVNTRFEIYNSGVYGCAQAVYAPGLYSDVIYLKPGLNTVEFTPEKSGTYKISCSMGMVAPVTVYVL